MGTNESVPAGSYQFTRKTEQLRLGQTITIHGQILEGPGSFAVKLQSCNDDIAFHFSPHFDERQLPYIACNTYMGKSWGQEERSSYVPFETGDSVEIDIKVEEKYYQVSVNGERILYYRHRLPPHTVTTVSVTGCMKSGKIQIDDLYSSQSPTQRAKMVMNYNNLN